MRRAYRQLGTNIVLVAALVGAAGCLSGPSIIEPAAPHVEITDASPEPVVQEFRGYMAASALARVAHVDAETEMLVADVQREGFVLEVRELPEFLQVDLTWDAATPDARMFAMVNIPTSVDGGVLDVFSERTDAGHVCMRVPLDEVHPGPLSMMAHSMDAVDVDYVMRITSIGGEVVVHEDRGHMEVERAGGEERAALPCPDAAST